MKNRLFKRLSAFAAGTAVALTGALAAMPAANAAVDDDGVLWRGDAGENRVWTLDELGGSISVTEFSYEGQPVAGTDFDGTPITGGVVLPTTVNGSLLVSYHVTIGDLSQVKAGDLIEFGYVVSGLSGQLRTEWPEGDTVKTTSGKVLFDYGVSAEAQATRGKFLQITSDRVLGGTGGLIVGEGVSEVDAGVTFDLHLEHMWWPDTAFLNSDNMGVFKVGSGSMQLQRTFLKTPANAGSATPTYPVDPYPSKNSRAFTVPMNWGTGGYDYIAMPVYVRSIPAANCVFDDSCVMDEEGASKDMYGFTTLTPTNGAKLTIAPNTLTIGAASLLASSEKIGWQDQNFSAVSDMDAVIASNGERRWDFVDSFSYKRVAAGSISTLEDVKAKLLPGQYTTVTNSDGSVTFAINFGPYKDNPRVQIERAVFGNRVSAEQASMYDTLYAAGYGIPMIFGEVRAYVDNPSQAQTVDFKTEVSAFGQTVARARAGYPTNPAAEPESPQPVDNLGILITDEDGNSVPSTDKDGNDVTNKPVDDNVNITVDPSAECKSDSDTGCVVVNPDGTVTVRDDENGNAPGGVVVTAEDTDGDGLIDDITITGVTPAETISDKIKDEDGNPVPATDQDGNDISDKPVDKDATIDVDPSAQCKSASDKGCVVDNGDGTVTIRDDENGNLPGGVVVTAEDTDGDGDIDTITVTDVTRLVEIYRMYDGVEHLYVNTTTERDALVARGWKYEGIAFYTPKTSSTAVHRLFQKATGDHHYTSDATEIATLTSKHGWTDEGVLFYGDDAKRVELKRLFMAGLGKGEHLHTADPNELEALTTKHGWKEEGISFYVAKYGS